MQQCSSSPRIVASSTTVPLGISSFIIMSAFRQTARALGKELPLLSDATEKWALRHAKNPRGVVQKLLPWGVFAGAAGGWLVFPCLTEGFKASPFGLFDKEDE